MDIGIDIAIEFEEYNLAYLLYPYKGWYHDEAVAAFFDSNNQEWHLDNLQMKPALEQITVFSRL